MLDRNDLGQPAAPEPDNAQGYVARARARQAGGDLLGAVADCAAALKLDPQYTAALVVRGQARQDQGYLDRAIADYTRALQIQPLDLTLYLLRGQVYAAQDKLDLACQDFDKAVEIDPQNALPYTYRAQVRAAQSDTEGAITDCNQALKIDDQSADSFLTRAAARWEQGDLEAGRTDCDEALRLQPEDARAYALRGNIREAQNDLAGARADFERATQLDSALARVVSGPELAMPVPGDPAFPPMPTEDWEREPGPEFDEAPEKPGPPGRVGAQSWVYAATIHGALAGAFFGVLSEGFAAALALLLFTPLLLAIMLRRQLTLRQAGLGGLVLAGTCIALYLSMDHEAGEPLMKVPGGQPLQVLWWLLAWTVFGALMLIFGGALNLGLIVAYLKGGLVRAMLWGRGGALAGFVLGGLLAGLWWIDVPGVVAGGTLGAVAGLLLGAATGHNRWLILLLLGGTGLGAFAGSYDLEGVFRVLGAGVRAGVYWTIWGGLVGIFTGASVGSKASERVVEGPLYTNLLGAIPLPEGQGFNLATGLLAAAGGLFLGASVGMVAGSIFGGLAVAASVLGPVDNEAFLTWIVGGAVLGALMAAMFSSRDALASGWSSFRGRLPRAVPLQGLALLFACLGGAVLGGGLAALARWLDTAPGGVLYWMFAGAGMGSIIGAKLWSVAER